MGTSGAKSGYIHEWEEAEINLRNSGIKMPPEFALVHYALLMYPSEVLGNDHRRNYQNSKKGFVQQIFHNRKFFLVLYQ